MLDASRNDVHLVGFHDDIAVFVLDRQTALADKKQLVRIAMPMPDEFVPTLTALIRKSFVCAII